MSAAVDFDSLPAQKRLILALKEKSWRARYNRLTYYKPYEKQREFHYLGAGVRERLLSAGNQAGKTLSASFETAMHLTGRYPEWWQGKVFNKEVNGWVASKTSEVTRDGAQRLLFGQPGVDTALGTGSIPKDAIVEVSPRSGVANAVSYAVVRHGGGGDVQAGFSTLGVRSYDMGRQKFQAATLDFVWLDEEPEDAGIYTESLTRTNATGGIVYMTFTPLLGMSETVRRFMVDKYPGTAVVYMSLYDVGHYTKEYVDTLSASYPQHERDSRIFGKPGLGEGAVFPIAESEITIDPFPVPHSFARIIGLDIGWDHPTAAAWLAIDRENGTVYLTDCYKQSRQPPAVHASAIRAKSGGLNLPVAWPHDALQTSKDTGIPMRDAYINEGLVMLPEKASFEDGSYGLEPGLQIMYNMMCQGKFKVFKGVCEPWLAEYRTYHRKNGLVVKEYDDLISASRYGLMMARFAAVQLSEKISIFRTNY